MKLKHLFILGLVLLGLGLAVVLKQQKKPAELSTQEYTPLNLTFDSSKVSKIEIGKGKDQKLVELVKESDNQWTIPSFFNAKADTDKITDLLKAIQEAKGELRAKEKSLFSDFEIGEEEAYRIALHDQKGNALFVFLLGIKRPQPGTVFIRRSDAEQVYLTDSDLFSRIGIYDDPAKETVKSDVWAQMILVNVQADLVDEILAKRFEKGREIITSYVRRQTDPNDLSKKTWSYERKDFAFSLDEGRIKQFIESFKSWPATKVLDPKARDYGFANPKWLMKLHLESGEEIVMTAGAEDPDTKGTFMQVSNEPIVFQLPSYYFKYMGIDDSKFFAENPLGIQTEKIDKVFIHTPSREVTLSPTEDKRDVVTNYLNNLKSFFISKLAFDPNSKIDLKSGQLHWVEIKMEGANTSRFIDVEGVALAEAKEYLTQERGRPQLFVISETQFKKLFEDLESLKTG